MTERTDQTHRGTGEHADLWDDVTRWLESNWNPDLAVDAWWKTVAAAGWTAPHFPTDRWGRGLSLRAQRVVRAAFSEFGALQPPGGLGLLMAAPTILAQGTAEQIDRLVLPILEGQAAWCQLFSEPGAGSDLAGLTTRATRDGDRWIVSGQKVWSSHAMQSDYGMLLARRPDRWRGQRLAGDADDVALRAHRDRRGRRDGELPVSGSEGRHAQSSRR